MSALALAAFCSRQLGVSRSAWHTNYFFVKKNKKKKLKYVQCTVPNFKTLN